MVFKVDTRNICKGERPAKDTGTEEAGKELKVAFRSSEIKYSELLKGSEAARETLRNKKKSEELKTGSEIGNDLIHKMKRMGGAPTVGTLEIKGTVPKQYFSSSSAESSAS
jgi:hypothetical protein